MLYLIPPGLHRAAYRAAHRLRLIWWRLARPSLRGCRILAFDQQGRLLLVRHSYGSGNWMLPAGGLGRTEDPVAGACRELAEEVGCCLQDARLAACLNEPLAGAVNEVHLVTGRIQDQPQSDQREVVAAQCFAPEAWPADLSPSHHRHLADWVKAAKAALQG